MPKIDQRGYQTYHSLRSCDRSNERETHSYQRPGRVLGSYVEVKNDIAEGQHKQDIEKVKQQEKPKL